MAARVASKLSASMPGILGKTPLEYQKGKLVLHLPESLEALDGEALRRRLKVLAQLLDSEGEVRTQTSAPAVLHASGATGQDDDDDSE
jgi:hypothetical protein